MAEGKKNKKLGRGLANLIGDSAPTAKPKADTPVVEAVPTQSSDDNPYKMMPIEFIHANPHQPRKTFDESAIAELADSIRSNGLIQPLAVRPVKGDKDKYEIIAGERRWRASQKVPLHEVPVIIHDVSDSEMMQAAIIENVQRVDLNPLEEAEAYHRLMDEFEYRQEDMAERVGKSRSYIANALRLMNLPADIKPFVVDGRLSAGHARALLTAENPSGLAKKIVAEGLSVRETEKLAKKTAHEELNRIAKAVAAAGGPKDADTLVLEKDLSAAMGMKVAIQHKGDKGGTVTISYKTLDDLDNICAKLNRP